MQGIDAAEALPVEQRTQCRQRRVGASVALLRPGDQKRLQQLGQALARQRLELPLGGRPVAGADFHLTQQQLRGLAVGQLVGELHGLGTAGDQAGDERLLQQVLIIGTRGQGTQELRCGGLRVRVRDGETADQEFTEHAGCGAGGGGAGDPAGGRIRGSACRQEGDPEEECAGSAAELLHPHNLRQAAGEVMRI